MTVCSSIIHSPLGLLRLQANDSGLTRCDFIDEPAQTDDGGNPHLAAGRCWLSAFFGARPLPRTPALDLEAAGAEPFTLAVWRALCGIPLGRTATYGDIAAALGNPNATRAVGQAAHCNPVAIIVPCHRVIGADGKLTGYAGGLPRKAWLLQHERRLMGERDLLSHLPLAPLVELPMEEATTE